jgi:LCP family protein required for cell wall assembly
MMNTSSKFGISTRQSMIAFVIMIVLILVASGFAEQNGSAQASGYGEYDYALAAPPSTTPTATPFQPILTTPLAMPSQSVLITSSETSPVAPTQPLPTDNAHSLPSVLTQLLSLATRQSSSHESPNTAFIPVISRAVPPTPIPPTPPPPTPDPRFNFTPQEAPQTSDEGRSWDDYAGPSIWPDIAVPGPVGILSHPEDQVNILLLGSDQREGDSGFRTDTIQLLTINPSEGTVKLTSFPRDLYVYIPGYTVQRINTAFAWGGFDALAETMEYNFGVRPEYYVLINFWSFVDVIDSIGGITVDIGKDLCDHRDNWGGNFCVSQGSMWMGGKTALWYVRSRYSSSDLDRGRRQQEVLEAAFKRVISLDGLRRAPELYDIYKDSVSTNVSFEMAARFIPLAAHLADEPEIGNYSIGRGQVYDWVNYSGAMVLVPMREPIMEVMREVISEP